MRTDAPRRGFTLIELLVFAAVFSAVIVGFVTVFIAVTRVGSRGSSAADVASQSQFLLQEMQYYIQSARIVDMPQDAATGTLKLRLRAASSSADPTVITLASGTVYLGQGSGASVPLTSNRVSVSNLSFTRHFNMNNPSIAYGIDSVSLSFTMSASGVVGGAPQYYAQSFQSSAAVLQPVPKIALVEQANGLNNTTNVMSVTAAFGAANATGSLLIAVASNVGTSTATASIADTAGNAWTLVASTSYPGYNQKMMIFDAVNAKNSSNTVTVSYGGNVNYPALFIYEYRGAATSTSFDASSTQNLPNTAAPSSGSASPGANVELLLAAMYSQPSTEVPAAGTGFTLETTSTASTNALYVEDMNTYVTGPVSANFLYSQTTPSSSVTLVTFK